MGEMEPNDYQLVRIGLLAAISDRAAELGEELFNEAEDTIDELRGEVAALREALAFYAEGRHFHVETECRAEENNVYLRERGERARAALAAVPAGCPLAGGTRGERVRAVEIDIHEWHEVQRLANALIFQMHLDDDMLGGHMREDRDALEAMLDALDAPPAGQGERVLVEAVEAFLFEWDVDPTDATGSVAQTRDALRALLRERVEGA